MIAIKTSLNMMPEYCDSCQWYECRPHPMRGWSEGCGLMNQCMDDDQPDEWIYDGNGRPKACPLITIPSEHGRLIDADEIVNDCEKYIKTLNPDVDGKEISKVRWLIGVLNGQHTIVPAERSDDAESS